MGYWKQPISKNITWWRHQMETFSALLAICAGNSPVTGEFPTQRPVTRSFDVYFDLRPNERLSKQSWCWWFETLSSPLWRHRTEASVIYTPLLTQIGQYQHLTLKLPRQFWITWTGWEIWTKIFKSQIKFQTYVSYFVNSAALSFYLIFFIVICIVSF